MKILLTGASGFVGSHILDSLRRRGLPTVLLLRPTSDKRFISQHLAEVEVRQGSINDPASLRQAMDGITHVIHCAGATKAADAAGFYEVNQVGTRNVVAAVNERQGQVQRLVHISSQAAAGPASPEKPAREEDVPRPVSDYGKSKLAGEEEVKSQCRVEHVVIRPPAVYGPRDVEILALFQAVHRHLLPVLGKGQWLSLVFVKDLAEATVECLTHPAVAGRTYFVCGREPFPARAVAAEIAAQMGVWTVTLPLPGFLLWPICAARDVVSFVTRKPSVLSLKKLPELQAPGWVCDPSRLERDAGLVCGTGLKQGIKETLLYYRQQNWL